MQIDDSEILRAIRDVASMQQQMKDQGGKIDELNRRLFGNGQPGALHRIDTRIATTERRILKMEKRWWKLEGARWAVAIIWPLVILVFGQDIPEPLRKLFHRG